MKILKKNQLTILVIALMLITAGYLNYNTYNKDTSLTSSNSIIKKEENLAGIGDAKLVYSNDLSIDNVDNEIKEESVLDTVSENNDEESEKISNNIPNETMQNLSKNINTEYFVKSRLERETMYSETIEIYQKLLENSNVSSEQKGIAQKEIDNINKIKNAIMISENLIKTKGIDECVIYVNDKSINVIVSKEELLQEDIAQIQNIIARELNAEIENIHISKK